MGGGEPNENEIEPFSSTTLSTGWTFREGGVDDAWLSVKVVPSTVHQDLIDNGLIGDPFHGFNEQKASQIGKRSWVYRTTFQIPRIGPNSTAVLCFDGLDTISRVRIDNEVVLESDNMFLSHRVKVAKYPQESPINLMIEFDPAHLRGRKMQEAHPDHKWICDNGDSSRLAVRKAQYHWGWDWGPELMCTGIWKPICLEVYSARVDSIKTSVNIDESGRSASIHAIALVERNFNGPLSVEIKLGFEGRVLQRRVYPLKSGLVQCIFHVSSPALWMPVGYGKQNLYQVDVILSYRNKRLDSKTRKIGLRSVDLVQEPDLHGKSFLFRINGVDIFCGGSCWIPADSFLTNVTTERYRFLLELVLRGNQNMIRVWGGGIYESDAFYDVCDELGILVWQDFPFACGNYPTYSIFLKSVRAEATQNLQRLCHHPSLVLLAGNNEDYQIAEWNHLEYHPENKIPGDWLKTDFPARFIYESLLPKVVSEICPDIPYHPGSPWGDGKPTSDPTVGDLHQWNVWHGAQEPYQKYPFLSGRFNSEFGIEALPCVQTLKSFLPSRPDPSVLARLLNFHNKATGHAGRLAAYQAQNLRPGPTQLSVQVYLSQLIQSEAMRCAYLGWRRAFHGRKCAGALVWQLNDVWPVTSWSIIDYFRRPKAAYYAIRRALAPLAVGITRGNWDWEGGHSREPESLGWAVWGASKLQETVQVDVEVRFICVATGKDIQAPQLFTDLSLTPNDTTEIAVGTIHNRLSPPHVLAARMMRAGSVIARDVDWPQPLKFLDFRDRGITLSYRNRNTKVGLKVERPVKCLLFEERDGVTLSDNAMDLVPGDEQTVEIQGMENDKELDVTYLCKWEGDEAVF